jgi:hypothetical protein
MPTAGTLRQKGGKMETQTLNALKRTNRLLIVWLAVLTVLLLVSVGANAAWVQAASDPPVHVYSAALDDFKGVHTEGEFIPELEITSSGSGHVILQKTVSLSKLHKHTCLVTASADVHHYTDAWSLIQFTLTMDSTVGVANHAAHRRTEFMPYSQGGLQYEELSTVMAFDGVSGTHTFYFIGRRNVDTSADASISAAGMLIVCL